MSGIREVVGLWHEPRTGLHLTHTATAQERYLNYSATMLPEPEKAGRSTNVNEEEDKMHFPGAKVCK